MKKDFQILTEVLDLRRDEVQVRTVLIVIRENGLRSRHEEGRWVRHFGNWPAMSKAVHDRLTRSVKKWVETGVADEVLAEYELE